MMKKLTLILISVFITSNITFSNPIMPESLIAEVYFDENDDWYLVVDVFFMEILGITSFQEIEMSSTSGTFVFKDDFLPDFSTYETIITKDALVYPHQLFRESDFILASWPEGQFLFMQLVWGNSNFHPVKGPFPGQSLTPIAVYEDEFYNVEYWLVKNADPVFLGGDWEITGVFDGFLFDQEMYPVANAEIRYVDDYLMNGSFSTHFPHIVTNASGYFIHDDMLACNYHLSAILMNGENYDFDEYISIEPDSTNTFIFQMVETGIGDRTRPFGVKISNYPNPFSDFTTFIVITSAKCNFQSPVLKIEDLMGRVVSENQLKIKLTDGNVARFGWENSENLNPGIYSYQLVDNGLAIASGKMVIR